MGLQIHLMGPDDAGPPDAGGTGGDSGRPNYAGGAEEAAFNKFAEAAGIDKDKRADAFSAFQKAVRACMDAYE